MGGYKSVNIPAIHEQAREKASARADSLAKPIGSLGQLEQIAIKLAAITGKEFPRVAKREILVFASDNGVHDEGITSVPQFITRVQAEQIATGRSGVGVLAAHANAHVTVVDIGVKDACRPPVINNNIQRGTGNIAKGPAMTREQCESAIHCGFTRARSLAGIDALGIGEMGICNTTTSSAVLAALTGETLDRVVGMGAGVTPEQLVKKRACVDAALSVNRPDASDVVDVLAKVGGLDIAAMTGAFIGGASARIPLVVDGFISMVAALCAVRIAPSVKEYLFASHLSVEAGYAVAVEAIGLTPVLALGMRLGEGSGCPIMMHIMDAACAVLQDMALLSDIDLSQSTLVDIREQETHP